jgi:hypothetical protein
LASRLPWFQAFKAAVYLALLANVGLFIIDGQDWLAPKAIDQIGWIILLGVFEWETGRLAQGVPLTRISSPALAFELAGYACALFALSHYIAIRDPVEIANASAWLAISVLIWVDLFFPETARTPLRAVLRWTMYGITLVCAIWWGADGAWLDFWDAAIWIVCFFVIEINIFGLELPGLRR